MTTTPTIDPEAGKKNLVLWDAVRTPTPDMIAKTRDGSGKVKVPGGNEITPLVPYALFRKATELFGPVGIGWGWTILEERYVTRPDTPELLHVLKVKFWYLCTSKAGSPRAEIEVFGQTMVIRKNSAGFSNMDEDAPKKSLTDALGKALSMIGFAADVYAGRLDDTKYKEAWNEAARSYQAETAKPTLADTNLKAISEAITPLFEEIKKADAADLSSSPVGPLRQKITDAIKTHDLKNSSPTLYAMLVEHLTKRGTELGRIKPRPAPATIEHEGEPE